MIPQYKGFEKQKAASGREILPAGGYVGKIISAKVDQFTWGKVLVLAYDVTEGEYTDFFKRDFDNNPNEEKKWRGTLRLNVPTDATDQKNVWNKRRFNNFTACLEESNPAYHWDWDETKLRGLALGFLVREREWEMNGNTGWTTEACDTACVEAIRAGKFRTPRPYPLRTRPEQAALVMTPAEDPEDLPF